MNKNFYKTIFSKSRGEMIAVAENVSAEGQTAANISCKTAVKLDTLVEQKLGLSVLSFSMMLMAGTAIFVTPVMVTKANIVADSNAAGSQRPTIMNSANGTTQVNIQTPTKAGVSMNHYQQFDVNQQGIVLNNSRQNTQTQLAGYIQANPWLAGGEAKVIVNQVNSTQASHLNGYIEVGGRKADVIIANPAGINVDGGGFINAGGVTLTTGKPILDQGNLKGFQIRDGLINITGQGLDTSTNDYTRLLSHAAQINAGVWAKDLQIVTGQNDIDAKNNISQVNTTNSNNTGNPKFAIDTGSLGGMYAGKISLISTDKGIGINNAGQIFASAGSIKISADGQLQNSGSVVAQHKEDASQATLDIQAKALNNSGSLSSLAKQSIQTNNLNNMGLIATSAELNIRNTEKMSNEGELSAGRIDIDTAELKNKSGQIVQTGLQDLAIESGVLLNSVNALIGYTEVDTSTGSGNSGGSAGGNSGNANNGAPTTAIGGGGTTSANTSITASYAQGKIKANKIENEKAQITANGGVELSTSQALENAGTLNLKKLSAQGESLKNTGVLSTSILQSNTVNFQNINGKIYTHTAEIQASHLDNQQGTIQSQNHLKIQANQRLNNQAGQIVAQSGVDIHDGNQNTLTVDNTRAGKILSEGDIQIQSGQLLHADQSELIANQNIQLKQKEHLTVDSSIQAGNQISIENATGLTNNNLLEAGNTLNISANDIKNSQKGILQANTKVHLSANNQIENTGLINSNGLTLIEASQKIQNLGTGQIYGDHIALQTSQLLNAEQQTAEGTKSAVIAARERLDIAAQQIENREQALLSSENQLAVGGKLNQNHLAEGVAQSLDNASARIQSAGDMYLSVNTLTNRNLHFSSSEKEVPNSRKQIIAYQGGGNSEILDASHVTGWGGQETVYLDGNRYEDYTKYDYTRYEKQDYVDSSAPAYIVSGGTLTLDGQNLSNNKSQILAAQGIKILQNDVDNIDAEGEHRVIQSGTSRYHYVGWNSAGTSKRSKWNDSKPYNPADIVTPKKLNVVKYDGSYQGANGGLNPTQIQRVQTEAVDDKTNSEIRTITPDLSLPNQSLFGINKNNNNEPLIETNRAFTQYKKWLGSDYMLNMLSTDPANMHKRLGDGYYEQKLINDQVAQLTGKVYLDGYTNYEEQFKALMDAGVSAAKNMSLTPGVALSEAQIARLTSDIVWMVTETLTLADGQKLQVLVPKVYALVQAGDLSGQGTLIAANTISMQLAGNLNNTGTIAGRQLVNLNGNNINNIGGLIQGREVYTQAKNDINNIGGQIRADQTLFLDAGNNINSSSTTIKTENKQGSSKFTAENIGRKAGLYVTGQNGQLIAQAKKDISLQASELNSQGSVSVQAGRDLNLSTVNVSRKDLSSAGDDDYVMHASSKDVGTQIQAKNDIQLKSGGAISIQAGTIKSQDGSVVVDAAKDLEIKNGKNQNSFTLQAQEQGAWGSKTNKKQQGSTDQSIATNIQAGGSILVNSQNGDIRATHLQADAKDSIQVSAKNGNVALLSDVNTETLSRISEKKGAIKFKNSQSGFIDQEVAQTTLKAGNSVDINAGKNVELQAIDIKADNAIYVGNTLMQRQADGSLKASDGSLMPENVTLSTLETHDQQWDEQQKGYRGIVKELIKTVAVGMKGLEGIPGVKVDSKLTVGESSSKRTEQINQTGSSLTASNIAIGSSGQTTLTSADIAAQNTILSGKKVTLNAAEEQKISAESHGKETIEGLGVKLNKDNIRLGGFVSEDTTQSSKTTETTHQVGSIQTENLKIQGADGVDILGQNITATGDTVIDHGRGALNIGGYENKTETEEKSHTETISTEVGVRNAYLDAALAVVAVKDAAKVLSDAKGAYSQAQRDYAAGKMTKEALDDSKANVAMATVNLASAQIAVAASAVAAAASTATYGFTIGANGERIETTTAENTVQGQWQGSNLDLNNLTLKSENQDVNIQGSRLSASGTTTFDGTKDLNVTAGTEHGKQDSSSKTNSQSVSYTYGGGGSASVGKQTSKSQSESLTHVNSTVELNKVSGSLNKLNIQGGEVSIADRGNLQVKEIHVESLQDTASSSNSSKGGNIGAGFGSNGKASNISVGYNQSKGNSDSAWVNDTSKLLIGNVKNDADLDAMGVQKVTNIGGVIANASKNSDGTLTDHGKLNYSGELDLKDIQDHNNNSSNGFNVSTTIGKTTQDKDGQKSKYPNGSTTIGLNSSGQETEQLTKATMGQGTVKNTADSTNRDINNTQEITRDQTTGMLDGSVTVDHRLLTESGRAEIIQQQKNLPQNAEIIGKMTAAGVTSLGVATAALASGDQNLKQAYDTVMNPARTFDFVQKHPEAATVIEQFKNGGYDGLLATKGSIQLLAQTLGQDVDVLTTSITSFLGIKGAFDHQTNTVVLDVTNGNRSTIVDTFGHEIAHGQGIKNETSADLIGKTVDWAFSSGIKSNQDTIDHYKVQLGDGEDAFTQEQNITELKKDNTKVLDAISDHGDQIDEKTSYWQDIKNLGCWSKECTVAYQKMDAAQGKAFRLGQAKAATKFMNDIKNLPNIPKEVYDALTKDPMGTMAAIWDGVKNIPNDVLQTGKTITKGNLIGSSPAEFEKLGNAEMTVVLNAVSAGTVTVVKKGGRIVVEAAKDANLTNQKLLNAQQIIGDQPYVAPKNTTGKFQTHGITVEQVPSSVKQQLLNDLKVGGFVNPSERLEQIIGSGKTVPVPIQATANTTLYKLVSTEGRHTTPHPQTEYWITRNQLNLIKANPSLTNGILGLPPQSHANTFNVFEIQPKPNSKPTIYQSQVATVTTPNSIGVGNATQTIVPNRNLWTTPKSINIQIKVK